MICDLFPKKNCDLFSQINNVIIIHKIRYVSCKFPKTRGLYITNLKRVLNYFF